MRSFVILSVIALLAGASAASSRADPAQCGEATSRYNSALDDVTDALRAYSRCVSDSRGHDDCSSKFSRLRSAQDDFESAVSNYLSECQ